EVPLLTAHYNIAPSQHMAVIRTLGRTGRRIELLRWGLVPSWAESEKVGYKMMNARGETIMTAPAFREPIRQRPFPGSGGVETEMTWYIRRLPSGPAEETT